MSILERILRVCIAASMLNIAAPQAVSQSAQNQTEAQAEAQVKAQSGHLRTHRFELENYDRRYKLYSPAGARAFKGPRPLVMVIHGGAGTDRGMIKLDKERWNALADEHGFYVAYPNAVDKIWDFGEGLISDDLDKRVDDLAYFRHVMDDASARKNIDQNRIFATGISRGGQASYYLACNMPERIRAVMPVAMNLPDFMENECVSGPPVAIAVMNGTADPIVPYDGGWIKVFRQKRDVVLSADETLALWRARNGCADRPTATSHIDKPGDKTSVDVSEWNSCFGAPVKLYKVNNGGHTWPSGLQYLKPRIVGQTSNDISAANEGWAFFSQF